MCFGDVVGLFYFPIVIIIICLSFGFGCFFLPFKHSTDFIQSVSALFSGIVNNASC